MPSFGRNIKVGMTKEATYNPTWAAPASATGTWIQVEGFRFDPISNDIRASFATGEAMMKLTEFGRGLKGVEGSFTMFAHKQQLDWILFHLLGKVVTTSVGGATATDGGQGQKHIFTVNTITPKSLAFVLQTPETGIDRQFQLTGCVITKLDFDFTLNRPIILTVNFIGADFLEAAETGTPAFNLVTTGEAWHKYPSSTAALTWNINGILTWGNVKVSLESIYADGTEESFEGGSNVRKRLERAADGPAFKATVTAQKLYTGSSLMTIFTGDTTFEATYKDNAAPTAGYHLGINLGKCKAKPPVLVPRGLSMIDEQIEFEAMIDTGVFYTDNDFNITTVDKQTEPITQ